MLTKMVNGVSVNCSPQEETEIRAEWAAADALPPPTPKPTLDDVIEIIKSDPALSAKLDAQVSARSTGELQVLK